MNKSMLQAIDRAKRGVKKCGPCDGTGDMKLNVSEHGSTVVKVSSITCVYCDGAGEVSLAQHKQMQAEERMWCKCDEPSEDADFYDDGEHPELHKHHYRCKNCKGVLQIG